MGEADTWLRFLAAALATWRVSHLIAFEDGPWDVIARIRRWAGGGFLGRLMDCFYCVSLWVAAAMLLLLRPRIEDVLLMWLAVSGAACLFDRLGHDPVTVKTFEEGGDPEHALLRKEPGDRPEVDARTGSGSNQ